MSYKLKQPAGLGGPKLVRPVGSGIKGPAIGLKKPPGAALGQQFASPAGLPRRGPGPSPARQGQLHPSGPGIAGPVGSAGPVRSTGPVGGGVLLPRPPPGVVAGEASEMEMGDRVLVGGGKLGTIAFLGPTQFARGVWAGVVLDTKDGKNNGCVNGVQYFQCDPNQGLFARPEKLTLLPKPQKIMNNAIGQPRQLQVGATPPMNQMAAPPTSFSVGDRVMVEGGKQGMVGFYGNTEFAGGVWVGVILEAADGKNNGTVAGVQYFNCPPNHGLFTRPQKLQLLQKSPQGGQPSSFEPHLPTERGSSEREPGSRGSSQQRSAPTPPISDLRALREKLNIGDRVLVGGAKEGFLRYLGPTEFAKGIWAGVELGEAMGKNDGAVSGKRYFQCPPRHGLFAPLPKVEKLADSGPPPDDVPEIQPSPKQGARQHNRQPSNSSSSSFGSGRPLVEVTPTSSLHGCTSAGLSLILQEKETTITSLQASLQAREDEGRQMTEHITELSRKVEDLQFQLEEQGVMSGEQLESVEEGRGARVRELEEELREEREARERLQEQLQGSKVKAGQNEEARHQIEALSRRLKEAEREVEDRNREVEKGRREVEGLRSSLESSRASAADLQRQTRSGEMLVQQLMADKSRLEEQLTQLSEMSGDSSQQLAYLQQQLQEKERVIEELYVNQTEDREDAEKAKDDFRVALERFQSETQQSAGDLSVQLQQAQQQIQELIAVLGVSEAAVAAERVRSEGLEGELSQAERAVGELRAEVASVKQDLQGAMELCGQHEELMEERNRELVASDFDISSLKKERQSWNDEQSRLVAEQQCLALERDRAIAECDRLMAQSASTTVEQSELSRQRQQVMSERDQLMAERQAQRTEIERVAAERDELLRSLKELHEQRTDAMGQSREINIKYDSLMEELSETKDTVERLRLELVMSQNQLEHEISAQQEQLELARVGNRTQQDRLDKMAAERDSALSQAQEMADRLMETERERDGLRDTIARGNQEINRLQDELEDACSSQQVLEREVVSESSLLEQQVAVLEEVVGERERELAEAKEQIETLTDELIISRGKRDQAMLEEEREALEERVRELTSQLHQAQKGPSLAADDGLSDMDALALAAQLKEAQAQIENMQQSLQDYEQQVEFLNSVIADLQQKLEAAESLALMPAGDLGMEQEDDDLDHLPPPRLFCDICDEFDQHDTDDCPLQATPESPPPTQHHGKRAPGGSDRPYCENCEMFDNHWTNECKYDVTY